MVDAPWTCWVSGAPKATQTGTVVRRGRRLMPLRRNLGWSLRVGLTAVACRPSRPFAGPLRVELTFSRRRPQRGGGASPTTRPDLGNLSKGLLDALEGIVYEDDAQIVELIERKTYDREPGVMIRVTPL